MKPLPRITGLRGPITEESWPNVGVQTSYAKYRYLHFAATDGYASDSFLSAAWFFGDAAYAVRQRIHQAHCDGRELNITRVY